MGEGGKKVLGHFVGPLSRAPRSGEGNRIVILRDGKKRSRHVDEKKRK